MNVTRPVLATALLAVSALTACGGTDVPASAGTAAPSAAPSSSVPSTSASSATPEHEGSGSPSSGASSSATRSSSSSAKSSSTSTAAAGATKECTGYEAKVSVGEPDGAAGKRYVELTFTNTSDHACRLKGGPHVSASSTANPRITTTAEVDGSADFVLKPGERAVSTLKITEAGNLADCDKQHAKAIYISDGEKATEPGQEPYAHPLNLDFCKNASVMSVTAYKKV